MTDFIVKEIHERVEHSSFAASPQLGYEKAMTTLTLPETVPTAPRRISRTELFLGFLFVGLRGFGGVLPWARQMIIEERHWLTEEEFNELYSLCNLLPGPNVVNVSVALGARFHGVSGSIAAFSGLMTMPLVIVLALGALYERFHTLPSIEPLLHDLSAAAAGLVLATGLKMARSHWRKALSIAIAVPAFIGVGLLHWSLIWVVLALVPISLALRWRLGK
jgi:chromate transporter